MATEEAVSEKTVFAFSKCSNIERKGNSSFNVTCNICGLQVFLVCSSCVLHDSESEMGRSREVWSVGGARELHEPRGRCCNKFLSVFSLTHSMLSLMCSNVLHSPTGDHINS